MSFANEFKRILQVLNAINANYAVKKTLVPGQSPVHIGNAEVLVFHLHYVFNVGGVHFYVPVEKAAGKSSCAGWDIHHTTATLFFKQKPGNDIMRIFRSVFRDQSHATSIEIIQEMKKIKVLHLSSEKSWRGGEQQIAYLIGELTQLGVENFVALKKNSAFEKYCIQKGIPHYSLPFNNSLDIRTAFSIKAICRKNNIGLIHLHSSKSHGIGVLAWSLGNRTNMVLSRRVDFFPKNNWFTRWKYNHPAIKKILCVSNQICGIMKGYVSDPEKCITIHSGVDTGKPRQQQDHNLLRSEFKIPDQAILIGNTSALEGHKDYFTFIDTIAALRKKELPVKGVIIGTGSLEHPLKTYSKAKALEDCIIFAGFRNNIDRLLPGLDIFLMTSKEEGLGTSVLDAFQSEVPVIATKAGGIPEMVIHGQTGLLAPIGNATLLAGAVETLVSDVRLRNALIRNAKLKVSEFSKELTARKTLQVYEGVVTSTSDR